MRLKNPEKNPSGLSQKYWIVGWWNHTPLTQRLEKNNAELLSSSDPHPETLFWHSFFHTIWIHLEIFKAYWFWFSFWHILWHSIWHPFSFLSLWDYWWDVQNHQWNKKCSSDYREAEISWNWSETHWKMRQSGQTAKNRASVNHTAMARRMRSIASNLASFLTYILAYVLTFLLAFYLASILTYFQTFFLAFYLI